MDVFSSEKKNKTNQTNLYIAPSVFKYLSCVYVNEKNKKKFHFIDYSKNPKALSSLIISTLEKMNTF